MIFSARSPPGGPYGLTLPLAHIAHIAHIALIGLSWARGFIARFHRYFDEFLEFPGYPGLPERGFVAADIPPFLSHLQKRRFDLALQMHGNGTCTNSLIALFGARLAAGFYVPGGFCPHPRLFTAYPDGISEVQRHLQLMGFLVIPPLGNELEFPLTAEDDARFSAAIVTQLVIVRRGRRHNRSMLSNTYYDRVAIENVVAGITDAVALSGGAWLVSAVAEATDDSYHDGACAGAALAVISSAGELQSFWPLAEPIKIEGICLHGTNRDVLLVNDPDDAAIPAGLYATRLPFV
ncbi:MAG: glycosyltransferase family 9 protein [Gammaproteobacteria bacterium]